MEQAAAWDTRQTGPWGTPHGTAKTTLHPTPVKQAAMRQTGVPRPPQKAGAHSSRIQPIGANLQGDLGVLASQRPPCGAAGLDRAPATDGGPPRAHCKEGKSKLPKHQQLWRSSEDRCLESQRSRVRVRPRFLFATGWIVLSHALGHAAPPPASLQWGTPHSTKAPWSSPRASESREPQPRWSRPQAGLEHRAVEEAPWWSKRHSGRTHWEARHDGRRCSAPSITVNGGRAPDRWSAPRARLGRAPAGVEPSTAAPANRSSSRSHLGGTGETLAKFS